MKNTMKSFKVKSMILFLGLILPYFAKAEHYDALDKNLFRPSPEDLIERKALMQNAQEKRLAREQCTEVAGAVVKVESGCLLTSNNLVYGPMEYIRSPLSADEWDNPSPLESQFRCHMSRRGGFSNWRLPTEQEVHAASTYFLELGIDPYTFYWSSSKENQIKTIALAQSLGSRTISSDKQRVYLGTNEQAQFRVFDMSGIPDFSSSRVYGEERTKVSEVNRQLYGEFDFLATHFKLVRPSLDDVFIQKVYSKEPVDVRGTLTYDEERTVDKPITRTNSYNMFLGQVWGSNTEEVGRNVTKTKLGSYSKNVDPREYGMFAKKPEDVLLKRIGRFCVRDNI